MSFATAMAIHHMSEKIVSLQGDIDIYKAEVRFRQSLVERLQGEVEAMRKDAERYRWLRQLDAGGIQVYDAKTKSDLSFIGEELDAAVDAAMAARPGGQG